MVKVLTIFLEMNTHRLIEIKAQKQRNETPVGVPPKISLKMTINLAMVSFSYPFFGAIILPIPSYFLRWKK